MESDMRAVTSCVSERSASVEGDNVDSGVGDSGGEAWRDIGADDIVEIGMGYGEVKGRVCEIWLFARTGLVVRVAVSGFKYDS
jgi:hypothetical protein